MAENKKYTVADFERYHKGQMTPKEMHELEKAALEDDFLADALEGYTYSKNPRAETKNLKNRLYNSKGPKSNLNMVMRIAAALVLIAAFSWLLFEPGQQTEVPVAQRDTAAAEENQIAAKLKDTSPAKPVAEPAPEKQEPKSPSETGKVEETTSEKTKDKIPENEVATLDADTANSAIAMAEAPVREELPDSKRFETRGFIDTGMTKTDSPATRRERFLRNQDRKRSAILKPADTARLKELKEARTFSNFIMGDPLPEPVDGWKNFDDYLQMNKPKLRSTGTVTLQFVISLTGYPTKIALMASTCAACEKHAVRLLRDGPRWKNSPDGKGEITLVF